VPTLKRVNVLVVDDAPQVRSRFVSMLRALPGVDRVVEACGVKDALPALAVYTPGVVILDVNLRDGSGLAFAPEVRRECPSAVLLVVSNEATEPYRRRSLEGGAHAFFDKSREFDALVREVARAADPARGRDPRGES
jgi:DNA-binding NarL/FixJ family response regulator